MTIDNDQPTTAAEFRADRERGAVQTLPSGRRVRLRTVTPDRLLREGKVPDILTPLMLKGVYQGVEDSELLQFLDTRKGVAEALEQMESLRIVCAAAMLEPRIVDASAGAALADDEILIEDLTLDERGWVFRLAFREAEFLATFRWEQIPDVAALPDGQDDSQPSE